MLAEFPSAADAVEWALAVQTDLRSRPPEDRELQLRIGINVDDVLDDGTVVVSTRRGKRNLIRPDDPMLHRANWFQKLIYRSRFPLPTVPAEPQIPKEATAG